MSQHHHHQQLEILYFKPIEPSSFGGVQPLIEHSQLDKNVVKKWLPSQNAYTLHKPVRKFFLRNKTRVAGIDDQWQANLVDMTAYGKYNDNFKKSLTIIDIFSKYTCAVPPKRKTAAKLVKAFKSVFEEG